MAIRNAHRAEPKIVWRISESAPMGEWVKSSPVGEQAPAQPPEGGSWVLSSFDLSMGSDVTEVEDTIPGELFDELFGRPE